MNHPTEQMLSVFEKRITFDISELPEIAEWKLGGAYTLELSVVQESRNEMFGEKMNATFVIKKVKAIENPVAPAGKGVILGGALGGQE